MKLTRFGVTVIVVVVTGGIATFVSSGVVAKIGAAVAVVGILFLVADQLPTGLMRGAPRPSQRVLPHPSAPEPEYVATTEPASEELWQPEQDRYRQRQRSRPREHDDAAAAGRDT